MRGATARRAVGMTVRDSRKQPGPLSAACGCRRPLIPHAGRRPASRPLRICAVNILAAGQSPVNAASRLYLVAPSPS